MVSSGNGFIITKKTTDMGIEQELEERSEMATVDRIVFFDKVMRVSGRLTIKYPHLTFEQAISLSMAGITWNLPLMRGAGERLCRTMSLTQSDREVLTHAVFYGRCDMFSDEAIATDEDWKEWMKTM